jgi:hypothetical protein
MTTQDNKNISTILTLESLQKKYENTMILYQQAQTNYNSALNGVVSRTTSSNIVTSNGKRYVLVPSKVFWGKDAIQQKSVSTINECVALCSADPKCTGATFDSSAKSCWTRSGNAGLVSGRATQTAIVSELVNAAKTAIKNVTGVETVLSTSGGTSDGRFIAPTGAQVLELGVLNATIHQINEHVNVDDLEPLAEIYEQILVELLA